MSTIKDVARLANVSVATVSYAMNGKRGVKPETKQRILRIAHELSYFPNQNAQNLVAKSTNNISVIVSGSSDTSMSSPITMEMIASICETCHKKGYRVLLNVLEGDREDEIPSIAQSGMSSAFILMRSRSSDAKLAEIFNNIFVPSLVLNREPPNPNVHAVTFDHHKCGYLATNHLIEMGHRHIGYLGHLPGISSAEGRMQGYKDALRDASIPFDKSLVVSGNTNQEAGYLGLRQLLKQCNRRPTAVFTFNDLIALGAMEALQHEGIRIPQDISLIGCDNIPNLHLLKIPLTTVATPFREIGRLAATKIMDLLKGEQSLPSRIVVESELRIRESVSRHG